tara:strand:- start:462 stop:668 length:207 start_codon:yes stop_codon:yes gene_type:complete
MKINIIYSFFIFFVSLINASSVYARCAVCVTKGMSGASIAVLVILSVGIILFFANMLFRKYLNKSNYQ